jgi:hypothetical protein
MEVVELVVLLVGVAFLAHGLARMDTLARVKYDVEKIIEKVKRDV